MGSVRPRVSRVGGVLLALTVSFGAVGALAAPAQAAPALAAPAQAAGSYLDGPKPRLSIGITHPRVAVLQSRLRMPLVTSYFGPITDAYVRKLQRAAKLRVTGVTTRKTWRALGRVKFRAPRIASLYSTKLGSPLLGSHPSLGGVAAPVTRFRDGGHAYYLFNRGLHSCRYTGKCMDLYAAVGEPVYAFADGILQRAPYAARSFGNYAAINHRDGTQSVYAHLATVTAPAGPVKAGALIGTVGCSGTSGEPNGCGNSAAHLHFEWSGLHWKPGQYGELPPFWASWRGRPPRCYLGC